PGPRPPSRVARRPARQARRSRSSPPSSGIVVAVPLTLVVQPADRVPQLVALRRQILAVLVVRLDLDRLLRDDLETESADPGDLVRCVCEHADAREPEVGGDLGADAVLARIGLEAELDVRLDRVQALLLELVRAQLVEQPDAAPLLGKVEEHACALLLD